MRPRLPRHLAIASVTVLAALGAAGCGFVDPPALTISRDAASDPFFSFSADELFAEIAKSSGAETGSSKPTSVPADKIAEVLTGQVRPQIIKQIMADRNIVATDADKALVERAAQQQQSPPSDQEIEFQTNVVALATALSNDFFAKPGNNIDDYARKYYDQRKDSFAQPAQLCLHVVTLDAESDPTGQNPPDAAAIDALLPQAQAKRARLNTEPFENVAKENGQSAPPDRVPGGDLSCLGEAELPPDIVQGLKDVPVGAISQPVRWQRGWVIARVDDRKAARTPSFDEVKADAIAATKQTFGQQFVTELLSNINKSFVVKVDPRFGRWSPEQGQVLTPEGAAAPTVPTTTTTLPTLGGEDGEPTSPSPTSSPTTAPGP